MVIEVIVEQYRNPCEPGGVGWMAHSDDIEACGVYGFGRTEQEAVDAFGAELEGFLNECPRCGLLNGHRYPCA